jgi:hypothetical protein
MSDQDTQFTDIATALSYCQEIVTRYFAEGVQPNTNILETAFNKKNKAIEACDHASDMYVENTEGKRVPNEITLEEQEKICTIKDIYVLAYFIMEKNLTGVDGKDIFLKLTYNSADDDAEFRQNISKIKEKMTGVSGFGQAQLIAAAVAPVTLSPPAAAPTLSPPAAAPVTLGPPTAAKANELLETAVKKLCDLTTTTNPPLENLLQIVNVINSIKSKFNYNKYYEFMGYLTSEQIKNLHPIQQDVLNVNNTFMAYIDVADIFNKVKQFIEKITYKSKIDEKYVFTLHDIVGYATPVFKYQNSQSIELSDYCKARDVFIKILQFIKKQYETQTIYVDFVYPRLSGLKKSSTTCNPNNGKIDLPLLSVQEGLTWSKSVNIAAGGGSKSRRTRRRKHSRKSHHKHARKTHHKRAPKSHKRKRHSRAARKHKKHTSRR